MKGDFSNLLTMEFVPFSEAKAKLSEKVRSVLSGSKRLVITTNGRPTGVLLSYKDYLSLLRELPESRQQTKERIFDLKEWRKGQRERLAVRDSIANLFDPSSLSRKGQKTYKQETVSALSK